MFEKHTIFLLLTSSLLIAQTEILNSDENPLPITEITMPESISNDNIVVPTSTQPVQSIESSTMIVSVVGQGVAPRFAQSQAHSRVLAKRAAIVDAYRQLAETIGGVQIEGRDTIKNMMVQNSRIRTYVHAIVRQGVVTEVKNDHGVCSVHMEVKVPKQIFYVN